MNRSRFQLSIGAVALVACALLSASCGRHESPVAARTVGVRALTAGDLPGVGPGDVVEAIVLLRENNGANSFMVRHGLTEVETLDIDGAVYRLVRSDRYSDSEELIRALIGDGEVKSVEPNAAVSSPEAGGQPMSFDDGNGTASATGYRTQAYVSRVHLLQAQQTTRGLGVSVGVLDTGIYAAHPEFAGVTIVPGVDFSILPHGEDVSDVCNLEDDDGDGYVDEGYGHGTHVAGIVHLVAPEASLVVEKVLNDEGRGSIFGVASAIIDALGRGATVLNLSLGIDGSYPIVEDAVRFAKERGAAVICSAGNQGSMNQQYPASYPEAFSVTAVNAADLLAPFANRNVEVDASAPGVDVISTYPPRPLWHGYASGDGTSMAAPFLSGVTALVQAKFTGLSGWDAANRAIARSTNVDALNKRYKELMGHGRVDAQSAVIGPVVVP